MKAIILAAGSGARFKPLTDKIAKPAIQFLNRPLIHYHLDLCKKAGILHVGINLSGLSASVTEAVASYPHEFAVHYLREDHPAGTAGGAAKFTDWAGDQEGVLILHGDTLMQFEPRHLEMMAGMHRAHSVSLVKANKDTFRVSSLIVDENQRIRQISTAGKNTGTGDIRMFAGAHYLAPGFLRAYCRPEMSDFIGDIFPQMILKQNYPMAMDYQSPIWADISSRQSYLNATGAALKAAAAGKWPLPLDPESQLLRTATGGILMMSKAAQANANLLNVEDFAVLGAGSAVLGEASLKGTVLLPGGRVGRQARLGYCVVGPTGSVPPSGNEYEEIIA